MKSRHLNFSTGGFDFEGIAADDEYLFGVGAGGFENFIRFCQVFSRKISTVVDVGANIGITTALASRSVPKGVVLAVEAGENNYRALRKNIASNRLENVIPEYCAAGESDGVTSMRESSAWGHRVDDSPWPELVRAGAQIPLRRVDTLLRDHGLANADVIKIDTEGWELEVAKGLGTAARDAVVFMEFNSWCLAGLRNVKPLDTLREFRRLFTHIYYFDDGSITRLTDENELHFLHRNIVTNNCCEDLLAANRELTW